MLSARSTTVNFLVLGPDYTLLVHWIFTLSLPHSTPTANARFHLVDHLRNVAELRSIIAPQYTLILLQLSLSDDLMELMEVVSRKRVTKVIAFLAQRTALSPLPEVLPPGDLHLCMIISDGRDLKFTTPNFANGHHSFQFLWAAALRASSNPSTNWNDFNPTAADLTLNGIESLEQLLGPALHWKSWVYGKKKLPEKVRYKQITVSLISSAPRLCANWHAPI